MLLSHLFWSWSGFNLNFLLCQADGGVQVIKEKQLGHLGVPSTAQSVKSATEFKPFSFEERDKERILRKEEKLREVIQFIPCHESRR